MILLLCSLVVKSNFSHLLKLSWTKTMPASSSLTSRLPTLILNHRTKSLKTCSKWLMTKSRQFWWSLTDLTRLWNIATTSSFWKRDNLTNTTSQWTSFLQTQMTQRSQNPTLCSLKKWKPWHKINSTKLSTSAKKSRNQSQNFQPKMQSDLNIDCPKHQRWFNGFIINSICWTFITKTWAKLL